MKTLAHALTLALVATLASCTTLYFDFTTYVSVGGGGSTTSTSAGGQGGASLCTPGTTQSCYSGDPATEGQGICQAGTQVCAADGMSWGACEGEVLPQAEDCATPEDEDCDGLAPPCKGNLLWAERFGDVGDELVHGIAADAAGNIFIAGEFDGSVDFGGGSFASAGGQDIFIVKLDPNGGYLWSKRFGGVGDDVATAVAVDSNGNVVVTGYMTNAVDFGGGVLTSAGGEDVFIFKLDPEGGHIWSTRFGETNDQIGNSVAVDPAGNVVVAGSFAGVVDFGGGALTSAGNLDVFVAKFGPDGAYVWSAGFGDAGDQILSTVGADAEGGVVFSGYFNGAPDFGGGALNTAGGADIFVAKLDENGGHVWSTRFGGMTDEYCADLAVDSSGSVLLTGFITGTADFGGNTLVSAGGLDIFVAKLDGNGEHVWSRRFGNADGQSGASVATDAAGNALVTGLMAGVADFGGGPLPSAGGDDIFVVKLDASDGEHVWSKRFGDVQNQAGQAISVDAAGNTLIAGYFSGSVDFGAGFDLTSAGGRDIFVAKFGP